MRAGQRQRGFTHHVEAARGRRHEFGAADGALGVEGKGLQTFAAVAVEQRCFGTLLHHRGQLPGQVVGVVDARVQAAHAEDRQRMRRIAGEQHAVVAIARQRHGASAVDRGPRQLPGQVAFADGVQVPLHEGAHVVGLQGFFGAVAMAQLPVDAPQVVGLAVHQHRAAAVPRGVEPGAAFGRVPALQHDVDDDVAAGVRGALQCQTQGVAHEALAPVAGHDPLRGQRATAVGVDERQRGVLRAAFQRLHTCGPAQIDGARRLGIGARDGLQQRVFDVVLLQVDHRRQALVRVLRHREAEDLGLLPEAAPAGPRQAAVEHVAEGAQPAGDFQTAARDTRRAAADAHAVVGFDHDAGHALACQPQRGRQPHRPAADDDHAAALRGRQAGCCKVAIDVRADAFDGGGCGHRLRLSAKVAISSAARSTSAGCPAR